MPTATRNNEIVLDSKRYRIDGVVQSRFDAGIEYHTIHMDDWRGGLGVEVHDEELARNRFWWSTANTLFKGHLILPRLSVQTGTAPALTPDAISFLAGNIYARWGTVIHKYTNSGTTWGAAVRTGLEATTGDFINITIDSTTYLAIADVAGYDYSSDGSSWSASTKDVKYMTYWDDRLWGITEAGQLWYAYEMGVETDAACLAIEGITNGELVTDLFTAPRRDGAKVIHVATNRGLWEYDVDNDRFVGISSVEIPAGPTNGVGSVFARNSIYYPAGGEIYEYTPGTDQAVDEIGPGNDSHGLPDDQKGRIVQLASTHNELLALIDPTALSNNTAAAFSILAYSYKKRSWRCLYEHGTANIQPHSMIVDNSYGIYRLWFSYGVGDIDYIDLPYEATNDMQTTDATYAASAEHITSWITIPDDQSAIVMRVHVHTKDLSANETVDVNYETNYSGSWISLGSPITTSGITTYTFGSSAGTSFTHLRFQVLLTSTSVNTNTPDLLSLDVEIRTKKNPKWVHTMNVNLKRRSPDGISPIKQFANLRAVIENVSMVELTFRDNTASYTYFVDVATVFGEEETGFNFRGEMNLTLRES